jgi:hypothetical protein
VRGHVRRTAVPRQVHDEDPALVVAEVRRLKQPEDENAKLKRLVADLSLDKAILQDVLRKKV